MEKRVEITAETWEEAEEVTAGTLDNREDERTSPMDARDADLQNAPQTHAQQAVNVATIAGERDTSAAYAEELPSNEETYLPMTAEAGQEENNLCLSLHNIHHSLYTQHKLHKYYKQNNL